MNPKTEIGIKKTELYAIKIENKMDTYTGA